LLREKYFYRFIVVNLEENYAHLRFEKLLFLTLLYKTLMDILGVSIAYKKQS